MKQPIPRTLKFCQTCNARERVITHGRCLVCGNPPELRVKATDPLTDNDLTPVSPLRWTWLDLWILVLCVTVTVYWGWHVVKWLT